MFFWPSPKLGFFYDQKWGSLVTSSVGTWINSRSGVAWLLLMYHWENSLRLPVYVIASFRCLLPYYFIDMLHICNVGESEKFSFILFAVFYLIQNSKFCLSYLRNIWILNVYAFMLSELPFLVTPIVRHRFLFFFQGLKYWTLLYLSFLFHGWGEKWYAVEPWDNQAW